MDSPTLRDLWLGNVCECEHMPTSPEYRRIAHTAEDQREKLLKCIPEQYHELLDQYTDVMYQLGSVFAEDAFVRGVRFGARVSHEILFEGS